MSLAVHNMSDYFQGRPERYEERLRALNGEHQRGIRRFRKRLEDFIEEGMLTPQQTVVVTEHLLRLGERARNPANTGNIEDLFCYTLMDTGDPIRAFAQALADSVKVVPLDPQARLFPELQWGQQRFRRVADLTHLSEGDKMLVAHTMVAYGDDEMWASACQLVRLTLNNPTEDAVQRQAARMAVQSQHLPSSSFVLARATNLTIDCRPLYQAAGYHDAQIETAQRFYDVCSEFDPEWSNDFSEGRVPVDAAWDRWRERYLTARAQLPSELIYQLASDTLTNFLDGTLESGKWTDASVVFGGVERVEDVPHALAQIVNQYIAEHIALHDRPASDLTVACAEPLRPWGIAFHNDRAVVVSDRPEKAALLQIQFEAALRRKEANEAISRAAEGY